MSGFKLTKEDAEKILETAGPDLDSELKADLEKFLDHEDLVASIRRKLDGHSFEVEVDQIHVSTSGGWKFDPDWTFTDKAGHKHYRDENDAGFPTMKWVEDITFRDGEEYDDGEWVCRECGEEIEPGMIPTPGLNEYRPGMTTYKIDGLAVSHEEAERFCKERGLEMLL